MTQGRDEQAVSVWRTWCSEERVLLFAGVAGLGAAAFFACSGGSDGSTSNGVLPGVTGGATAVAGSTSSVAGSASAGRATSGVSTGAGTVAAGRSGAGGTLAAGGAAAVGGATVAGGAAAVGGATATAGSTVAGSSSGAGAAAAGATAAAGSNAGAGAPATSAGAGGSSMATAPDACGSSSTTAENTSAVVDAANAFLAALSSQQQTAVKFDKTLANAQQWSNLPTTFVKRNGVKLSDMSSAAQSAAVALAQVAAGTQGGTLFSELREADEFLVTDGGAASTDYGRGLYYFAIHGAPSTSAAWMLQVAGHHLAYNFTYGGKCTGATPLFDGVEPTSWTDSGGKAHAPLEAQRAAMVALLASVGSQSGAKLSGTFSDLIAGPVGGMPGAASGGDTNYPSRIPYPTGTTGRGVLVSTLSAEQKSLVKTALEAWVKNVADPVSSALLESYESEEALAQTYVGYSGSADLTTQASYVRIDGPRVWIEVTVQGGIIYRDKVHYHTIWRDKAADYGAEYASL